MRGITFDAPRPFTAPDPNRMDVACFVGFVPLRNPGAVPEAAASWLAGSGWRDRAADLWDVPVPVESWQAFQDLFAGEARLDSIPEVAGSALPELLAVAQDDERFVVVVDGETQEVALPPAPLSPEALADELTVRLARASARVEWVADRTHLVIARDADGRPGRLTVFRNPSLGFGRAVAAESGTVDCYLAAAVRAFFAQGGRRCYVVAMGEPLPLQWGEADRMNHLARLLFGTVGPWAGIANRNQAEVAYLPAIGAGEEVHGEWHGVEHLLGLDDVSLLCLPDLPDLVRSAREPVAPAPLSAVPEVFVECSEPTPRAPESAAGAWHAPRCDRLGFRVWARVVGVLTEFLRRRKRDVHLVAGLPLPAADVGGDHGFTSYLLEHWFSVDPSPTSAGFIASPGGNGLRTAFVQLGYPWLRGERSRKLPGRSEPPDGALAGLLAANALTRGAYRSAAATPLLDMAELMPTEPAPGGETTELQDRVSLWVRTPQGLVLGSDVTPSADPVYRPAAVSRTVALLLRAARQQGRVTVFEPSSRDTWRAVERSLQHVLSALHRGGGLAGATAAEAFQVRCDLTTMTRNDLDNGRLVAVVSFLAATPIERIHVALSLDRNGRVAVREAA